MSHFEPLLSVGLELVSPQMHYLSKKCSELVSLLKRNMVVVDMLKTVPCDVIVIDMICCDSLWKQSKDIVSIPDSSIAVTILIVHVVIFFPVTFYSEYLLSIA